jgi:hypothetical protein
MMGEGTTKEYIEPEAAPRITPEMIWTTLKALEAKGMVRYTDSGAYIPTEGGWKLLTGVKPAKEEIAAWGHPKITARNMNCFGIIKNSEIGKDVDYVVAVKANKSCKDLKKEIRDALKEARKVEITIEAEGVEDRITAYGSPALKLTHPEETVIRKSDFIDSRTLAILADKSANELKQELIEKLRDENIKVKITLEIKP